MWSAATGESHTGIGKISFEGKSSDGTLRRSHGAECREKRAIYCAGPGFALPHEALNAGAVKVGMSLIRLAHPVPFGKEEMDPVEWVCCLSAINKETHLKAMFQLVNLFYDPKFRKEIQESKTPEEVFKVINQYEYETR